MGLSCSRGQRRRNSHDQTTTSSSYSSTTATTTNTTSTNNRVYSSSSSLNFLSSPPRSHPLPLPPVAITDPSPSQETSFSFPYYPLNDQTTTTRINTTSNFETYNQVDFSFSFSSWLNIQSSTSLPRSLPPPSSSNFSSVANAPHPIPMHPNPIPSNSTLRNLDQHPMIDHANPSNDQLLAPFRADRMALSRPAYVRAKKIESNVNVHKDSIKLNRDANYLDSFLLSFTFDALVDGSITIFYFAKEGKDCITPIYPEYYLPMRIPFQKGSGQKFFQPSGTGIDIDFIELFFFGLAEWPEDIFPLIISVETCLPPLMTNLQSIQPLPTTSSSHSQITQAVLEKNKEGQLQVKVNKQILWIDGVCYELRELYGVGNSDESGFNSGKECIICLTQPKDIAVLPCRHMCMCSDCAKTFRVQSNKCPICRQLIEELLQIKG